MIFDGSSGFITAELLEWCSFSFGWQLSTGSVKFTSWHSVHQNSVQTLSYIDFIYWLWCWQIWLPRVQRFAR